VLYEKIKDHPYLFQKYGKEIGLTEKEIKAEEDAEISRLNAELEAARASTAQPKFFNFPEYWKPYSGGPYNKEFEVETRVPREQIAAITEKITAIPKGFSAHPKLGKLLEQRAEMGRGEKALDWGTAEALAFGTLVWNGIPVRLAGQDSCRGTFSHRHSVYVDAKKDTRYFPLANLKKDQAKFEAYDSVLSEAASVGFEYGYSREYPEALVLWEAQFGDFANGAQIIIDQFLTAAEDKWGLLSGLVLLLPHGYEGQGPEHSSARLERYLQLCGEDNIQVAQPSTAGQYFHLLRRQALRKWRKPLIVMTPKSMLRLPASCSPLPVLTDGKFETVFPDEDKFHHAERILVCSGKIVHELRAERGKREDNETAIIAIEQLYPFPEEELAAELEKYSRMRTITWVQEEPANMGALSYVRPYLEQFADLSQINAVRRSASASPATGSHKAHELEQKSIIKLAFANYR
jgi:2-oxoglutarate dehydrogenase E1 component